MPFKLIIIGSGAATPTLNRGVTSQYLNFNERYFLIDCGEGTQLQLRKNKVKFQRIQSIFISHLHGDHFFGLFGLLSSMSLLGRTKKITIFAPEGLEEIVMHQFKIAKVYLSYEIDFITLTVKEKEVIFEDSLTQIFAFPLKHRVTCFGFLFQEKKRDLRIDKRKISQYKLTLEEILAAKRGFDIERETETIENEKVTLPPVKPISYAYCTDTQVVEKLPNWIKDASLLYHEATFDDTHKDRAKATGHSTASQAAGIAKNANVDKLLLGHFSSRYTETTLLLEEAKAVFENVVCVEDGDVYLDGY